MNDFMGRYMYHLNLSVCIFKTGNICEMREIQCKSGKIIVTFLKFQNRYKSL